MKKNSLPVLVQMDPIQKVQINTDSTILIVKEGLRRGHNLYYCDPSDIVITSLKKKVRCKKFEIKDGEKISLNNKVYEHDYSKFKVVFLRQDPPVDMDFITNLQLNIAQEINDKKRRVIFINNPYGILKFSEKLYALDFPGITPQTSIFNNLEDIDNFLNKNGEAVIKPLYDKGGSGVSLIKELNSKSINIIKNLTDNYTRKVVVQKFIKKVSSGDKRVLLINGEPVGAVNRVPSSNNFKANLHLGAEPKKTQLTKTELNICKIIKPSLLKNGLFFVGIDIINNKLTEINVTSPTGIKQINELDNISVQKILWGKIEQLI